MKETNVVPKSVVITGAASGIGRATAQLFAKAGYRVALIDIEGSDLDGTLKLLSKVDRPHLRFFADVSSSAELTMAFSSIESDFGGLAAAVNNAGIDGGTKKFLDCTEADFERILNVNLKGTFLCLQHELRIMNRQRAGAIVNLASMLGLVGAPGSSIYSSSKHGVLGLTKSLAIEFAKKGIRINAVCPGGVDTAIIQRARTSNPALIEKVEKAHPIGRFGTAEEIAQSILWLCSNEASFVVGHGLVIDGGYTVG